MYKYIFYLSVFKFELLYYIPLQFVHSVCFNRTFYFSLPTGGLGGNLRRRHGGNIDKHDLESELLKLDLSNETLVESVEEIEKPHVAFK